MTSIIPGGGAPNASARGNITWCQASHLPPCFFQELYLLMGPAIK